VSPAGILLATGTAVLRVLAICAAVVFSTAAPEADAADRRIARAIAKRVGKRVPHRLGKAFVRRPLVRRRPASGPGRLERRVFEGRELTIYLPAGYRASERRRYPLLILQDGQNLFGDDGGSWQVHRAMDAEIQTGRAEPVIVVGIPAPPSHEGRAAAYAVSRDPAENLGGDGAAYIELVADRLVPWLRRELRVRPGREHTAIGGSSMGARIALEAALARPEVFGKVLAHSPSLWFNDEELLKRVESDPSLPAAEIYIDSGGSGTPSSPATSSTATGTRPAGASCAGSGTGSRPATRTPSRPGARGSRAPSGSCSRLSATETGAARRSSTG
jgi:predicted alpha/beta superfamily hydrolase